MRLLILDDDPIRHNIWNKMFSPRNEVVNAHTIDEFNAALKTGRFDIIFLDHDLNDHPNLWESKIPGGEGAKYEGSQFRGMYGWDWDDDYVPGRWYDGFVRLTGKDAARAVASLPSSLRPTKVMIHSWNDLGALQMWSIINEAGIPVRCKQFPMKLYFKEKGYQPGVLLATGKKYHDLFDPEESADAGVDSENFHIREE